MQLEQIIITFSRFDQSSIFRFNPSPGATSSVTIAPFVPLAVAAKIVSTDDAPALMGKERQRVRLRATEHFIPIARKLSH